MMSNFLGYREIFFTLHMMFTKDSNFMFKAVNQFQIQQLHTRQETNIGRMKNECYGNPLKG